MSDKVDGESPERGEGEASPGAAPGRPGSQPARKPGDRAGARRSGSESQEAQQPAGRRVVKVSLAQAAAAGQPAATARLVPQPRRSGTPFTRPFSRPPARALRPAATAPAPPLRFPRTDAQLLALGGLASPACAARIEAAVRAVPGVEEAEASPGAGLLAVAPGSVDGAAVRAAVGRAGHRVLGTGTAGVAGPTRLLLSGAAVLGAGALALLLRHAFGLFDAALAAAVAGVFAAGPVVLPVLRHLIRGRTVPELLPLGATLVLLAGAATLGEAMPVELAPFPLAAHLLGLGAAAALRQRNAAAVARLRAALPASGEESVAFGGTVTVGPGAALPTDGRLVAAAVLDERPLGGEEAGLRLAGEEVSAGSLAPAGCELVPSRQWAGGQPGPVQSGAASPERSRLARGLSIGERALATAPEPGLAELAARALPFVAVAAAVGVGIFAGLPAAAATLAAAAPLALGLAAPLAVAAGLSRALDAGAVPRSGAALLRAGRIRTVILDHGGVLLRGAGGVVDLVVRPGEDALGLLALAAAASSPAAPLGPGVSRALALHAAALGAELPPVTVQETHPGFGLTARAAGHDLLLGTLTWLTAHGIDPGGLAGAAEELARRGHRAVWLAVDGAAVAIFGIGDVSRDGARRAVGAMELLGVDVLVAGGDAASAVRWLVEDLGLDRDAARGELGTDGRLALVREARGTGPVAVAAAGPAWAAALADSELAVSLTTDPAVERASAVLLLRPDAAALAGLLAAGQAARRATLLAAVVAGLGNAAGLTLAATGVIGPLGATGIALLTTLGSLGAAATAGLKR